MRLFLFRLLFTRWWSLFHLFLLGRRHQIDADAFRLLRLGYPLGQFEKENRDNGKVQQHGDGHSPSFPTPSACRNLLHLIEPNRTGAFPIKAECLFSHIRLVAEFASAGNKKPGQR
ncbi:hypothetical protein NM963_23380 [Agrobacterium tumefaciens]|nr:hypothetical protein [Agrobacterium tumefaciens]MCW8057487.1 hypothetical protein [Agrobacterium tumefaciens]MCW8146768.1 hypothetical protein [Agrobacterium tumefaciens]